MKKVLMELVVLETLLSLSQMMKSAPMVTILTTSLQIISVATRQLSICPANMQIEI